MLNEVLVQSNIPLIIGEVFAIEVESECADSYTHRYSMPGIVSKVVDAGAGLYAAQFITTYARDGQEDDGYCD